MVGTARGLVRVFVSLCDSSFCVQLDYPHEVLIVGSQVGVSQPSALRAPGSPLEGLRTAHTHTRLCVLLCWGVVWHPASCS